MDVLHSIPNEISVKLSNWQGRSLLNDLHNHLRLFGYEQVETPIIEEADLFLTKAGDQIAERLFVFERYGHRLALRPEFTAAAAYKYIQSGLTKPVRWQFSGPVFEDSPTNLKTNFQTMSAGAELLGMDGAAADAEIISMAAQAIEQAGIGEWQLVIGHVGLTRRLLEHYALDSRTRQFILHRRDLLRENDGQSKMLAKIEQYLPIGDHTTDLNGHPTLGFLPSGQNENIPLGQRTQQEITRRLIAKRQQSSERDQILGALDFLQRWMNIDEEPSAALKMIEQFVGADIVAWPMLQEWQEILALLEVYGISIDKIKIKPDLARTWDYYTGIVFEIHAADGTQLAGGGRYDELAHLLGSDLEIPAVGVAFSVDEITKHLATDIAPEQRTLNLVYEDDAATVGIKWANLLREYGYSVAIYDTHDAQDDELLKVRTDGSIGYKTHIFAEEQLDFLLMTLDEGL